MKTQAETAGASADQIADIERKGLQKRIDANKKASADLLRQTELLSINSVLTEEDRTKKIQELQTQSVENGRKLSDLQAEQRQFEADDEKRKAEERRKRGDKQASDAKDQAGKLKLVNPNPNSLQRMEDGFYDIPGEQAPPDGSVRVAQGAFEMSNVNPTLAMVQMIDQSRLFDLNFRAVQTADQNARSATSLLSLSRG